MTDRADLLRRLHVSASQRKQAEEAVGDLVYSAKSALRAHYGAPRAQKRDRSHESIRNRTRALIESLENAPPHVLEEFWDNGGRWAIPEEPMLSDFPPPASALQGMPHVIDCLRRLEAAASSGAEIPRDKPANHALDALAYLALDVFERFRGRATMTPGGEFEAFATEVRNVCFDEISSENPEIWEREGAPDATDLSARARRAVERRKLRARLHKP